MLIFNIIIIFASTPSAISTIKNIFVNTSLSECAMKEQFRQRRSLYPTKQPLNCPPCQQIKCLNTRKNPLQCKGGYTSGICGCCRVCAKVEGELCGGEHEYLGKCDKGLACEPQPPEKLSFTIDDVKTQYLVHRGICKKASAKVSATCKPRCDPGFCNKNPRAICSAKENVESKQICQGACQHTSCRACRFVEREAGCPKCAAYDFNCIKKFGRCHRKKSCKPKKYPCGSILAVQKTQSTFMCVVPECVENFKV